MHGLRRAAPSCAAFVVAGFLAVGCGSQASNAPASAEPGAGEASSTTVVETAEAPPEPAILTITEMTITAEGEDGAMVIEADGAVVIQGVRAGKLNGDGRIMDKDGKQVATVDKDGLVTIDNFPETFTIAEDGSFTFSGRSLSIAEDGTLVGLGADVKIVFTGPKEGRRAAMVAFILAMTGGSDASSAPAPAPAPVPAPAPDGNE